jgi:adhesin transport system outer membrane protein
MGVRCIAAVLAGLLLLPDASLAAALDEELRYLLQTHPRIKARRSEVAAAAAAIREARAGWLPSVSLSGDAGYNIVDSPGRRATAGDPFSGDREHLRLSLTQNLFDGFRTTATKTGAEVDRDIAAVSQDIATQRLLFEGVSAYIAILRQGRLLAFARLNEETVMRQLNLEDERVRAGSGLGVDVLFAKTRLQVAKERRVAIEGRLENAVATYEQVFGRAPEPAAMPDPEPPMELLPADLENASDIALKENPLIVDGGLRIDSATQRRRVAESDFFPTIDLVGEGILEDDVDGTPGVRREIQIFVRANWELFSGFETRARVARASHERLARIEDLQFTNRRVAEDLRLAWQALETLTRRVALLENAVKIGAEVFTARQQLRAAGQETAVNVLDAENELNDARSRLAAADYDRRLAVYRLLLAIGRLTPEQLGLEPDAAAPR